MGERPRATVVIPCFNHGRFVADAVRSALAQHDAEVRVAVIDDGSTDPETAAACAATVSLGPNVRAVRQDNRGLPAARNAGAAIARAEGFGEYLVFLDADDWIEPKFVSRLHQALLADPAPDVSHAFCQEQLVELGTGVWRVPEWDPILLLVTNLHPVTALIKREAFERASGFDESLTEGYEDWDFWIRLSALGCRGVRVREPLFVWRRHSDNTMAMAAAKRHATLHGAMMERHAELYLRHAKAVIALSNILLRRADANWIDENGEAIYVRDLRARNCELFDQHEAATRRIAELEQLVREYEQKPAVRLSRAMFKVLDAMPRPVGEPMRALARWARRRAL
ncbi:MAG: glycosyltransferase family 2 protein [Phycisphaerales bacterium]|nr:glycosyltransferase family 2 protein [Phycisphaerales bacterium]